MLLMIPYVAKKPQHIKAELTRTGNGRGQLIYEESFDETLPLDRFEATKQIFTMLTRGWDGMVMEPDPANRKFTVKAEGPLSVIGMIPTNEFLAQCMTDVTGKDFWRIVEGLQIPFSIIHLPIARMYEDFTGEELNAEPDGTAVGPSPAGNLGPIPALVPVECSKCHVKTHFPKGLIGQAMQCVNADCDHHGVTEWKDADQKEGKF